MTLKPSQVLIIVASCVGITLALYGNYLAYKEPTQPVDGRMPTSGVKPDLSEHIQIGDLDWIKANHLETIDYLVITSGALEENIQPLVEWKTQRGLVSTVVTTEEINQRYTGSDLGERIRNCIKQHHSQNGTIWVLLAGGDEIIPSRSVRVSSRTVKSDYYYSNLDDNWALDTSGTASIVDFNDWGAEVYVGRLPADNAEQMDSLVARIIDYEKSPPVGPWMTHALFAGTFCTFSRDSNGNNVLDEGDVIGFDTNRNHNWLREHVIPSTWTSTLLAEHEGAVTTIYPSDGPLNQESFIAAINAGASIVMSDSHGSEDAIFRSIFLIDKDGDKCYDSGADTSKSASFLSTSSQFNTAGKNGFFFLAACMTGTFTMGDCLTEYIVRTCGIGAIGSYESANYDSRWYNGEHLGWVAQGLSTRFWQQLIAAGKNHPGMALSLAKANYSEDKVSNSYEDARTLAQFNLMGDPEVPIWTTIPAAITAEVNVDEATNTILVRAMADAKPLSGVTITLTSSSKFATTTTNESGEASLLLPRFGVLKDVTITFSKIGFLPYQTGIA